MKYLVSTKDTQGKRKNDFCFVEEGEFLNYGFECDGEKVNGKCGCKRALCGIYSSTGTTTMKVVEITPEQAEEIKQAINNHLQKNWLMDALEATKMAENDFASITKMADYFPVNAIIEKRGKTFCQRA